MLSGEGVSCVSCERCVVRLLPPEERRFKPPARAPVPSRPAPNRTAKGKQEQTLRVGINMPDGTLVSEMVDPDAFQWFTVMHANTEEGSCCSFGHHCLACGKAKPPSTGFILSNG